MKRLALLVLVTILYMAPLQAAKKVKKDPPATKDQIHWISIDELQVKMKESPKKVYIDMYTDWCGWCKKMEGTTFQNPEVIAYLNEKFYCVHFNAERKDTLYFMGKPYYFDATKRANQLAYQFMNGAMSYPTNVFIEEYFKTVIPVPGYQDITNMEMILKYFGENTYKTQKWEDYRTAFRPSWGISPNVTPDAPPGH